MAKSKNYTGQTALSTAPKHIWLIWLLGCRHVNNPRRKDLQRWLTWPESLQCKHEEWSSDLRTYREKEKTHVDVNACNSSALWGGDRIPKTLWPQCSLAPGQGWSRTPTLWRPWKKEGCRHPHYEGLDPLELWDKQTLCFGQNSLSQQHIETKTAAIPNLIALDCRHWSQIS